MTDAMVRLSNSIFQEFDVFFSFNRMTVRINDRKSRSRFEKSEAKTEFDRSDRVRAVYLKWVWFKPTN